jgi:hypothetical protein
MPGGIFANLDHWNARRVLSYQFFYRVWTLLRLAVAALVRLGFTTAERATSTNDSKAAFTASLVGNIFANSGVSKTKLLPF